MGALSKAALVAVQLSGLAAAQLTVNTNSKLQTIDGFGISQAFGRAAQFQSAASAMRKTALDYLFSTTTGAGFSIIRNRIGSGGSGDSIEPSSPGSPSATPQYTWDDNDAGQVWFSKQAMSYGVKTIYADAWSAPGFMKTNGNEANGGYLCGTTGHTCSSGDWRQAYANFLTKYIQYYAGAGIPITHVGFLNEPDYTTTYSSMQISTNAQEAISFIPTLRSTLNAAGLQSVQIACCDATGWPNQKTYATALMAANMQQYLGVITSHTYSGFPTSPLSTPLRTWITEGCPQGNPFVSTWYSSGGVTEGMTYANYLAQGFVNANLSAWVFWEGFEIDQQSSESHLLDTSGSEVVTSGIYWAFVMWSRWIRPGAQRLALGGSVSGVLAFAAQNTDGSVVVVLTNSGSSAQSPSVAFSGGFAPAAAQAWVTANGQNAAATGATLSGAAVTVSVPAHGVVTIKLTGGGSTGSTTLKTSTTRAASTKTSTSTSKVTTTSTSSGGGGSNCSALYGQCGGQGWTGPTCCASGSTCKYSNDWYSQCL